MRNAMALAERLGVSSLAFPVIGAGSGGFNETEAERVMMDTFAIIQSPVQAVLVRFRKPRESAVRIPAKPLTDSMRSRSGIPWQAAHLSAA